MRRSWRLPNVLLLSLAACSGPAAEQTATESQTKSAGDDAAISAVIQAEHASFVGGNSAGVVAVLAPDVTLKVPGEPPRKGIDAARAWLDAVFKDFTVTASPYTDLETTVAGDYAFQKYGIELTLTPKAGGAAITEKAHGLHVLQRQADGSWKIVYDIWNSDAPPPPSK